jgi:hypothetical protein
LIAFNLILNLNKDAYLIWNNFFGWFLFALAVMTICMAVWTFIYGLFVVPISMWLFPGRWKKEASEAPEDTTIQV